MGNSGRSTGRVLALFLAVAAFFVFEAPAGAVETPVTVPVVPVTVPITLPVLPTTIPVLTVPTLPTLPTVTVPATTTPTTAASNSAATPTPEAEPTTHGGTTSTRAKDSATPRSSAIIIERPGLIAAAGRATSPFAMPLLVMALIVAYLVFRAAFDRRDVRLASAPIEDRWVGFE